MCRLARQLLILAACVLCQPGTPFRADEPERIIRGERLRPTGARYQAVVPDTLDLAERARLAVHGLTSFLNPRAGFAPYGHTYFNGQPPYLSDMPGGPPNWGKIAESLIYARLMCGSEENLDVDARTLEGMLASPWMVVNPEAPTPVSCGIQALLAVYQLDPHPALKARIDAKADSHLSAAKSVGQGAYYYTRSSDLQETVLGVFGDWMPVFIGGRAIRPLTRWAALSGDAKYRDFAGKLSVFLLSPRFWAAEAEPKVVVSADHGHFSGHHHSYTQGLMGLLWQAEAAHDARREQFVREAYEYLRNFGIARIGLFGEGCTVGDMTQLAIKLSDIGSGDYWDDADQYLRNHLAELQITDAGLLARAVAQMPQGRGKNDTTHGPYDPKNESNERVIERNVGVFMSDATHPTLIPEHCLLYTICCTGNCTPALYAAWEATLRCRAGAAQVNLLLNRASQWFDVESSLPYEGKVVVRNKTARSLAVRIPRWVEMRSVLCRVNKADAAPVVAGRYLVLSRIEPLDVVTLTFPLETTTEAYTLKWRQSEFWKESTNPGPSWQPPKEPSRYVCTFRGNTLVDITPRDAGPGYPLYVRGSIKAGQAPTLQVTRYLPPVVPSW